MTQRSQVSFDNSYARLPEGLYTNVAPTPVKTPSLITYNAPLADAIGIDVAPDERALLFSGNLLAEGSEPLAQLYAGHQFGQFNPQLGDGRAHLLGEVIGRDDMRYDIQLKGSGATPYSRSGDGRAWLGPVLREYVISEAMHALGVPTTRALAAVRTGETIFREAALPGAILTRVAQSHIRVGTFEVFASRNQIDALQALFEHTSARHYPNASDPRAFLEQVIARQSKLIAQWLGLGFIHGVMNTDNCLISGQTIDYGPCAFLDVYKPNQVFSSIDRMGRYAYDNQARVITWNMAQLANALIPLMPDEERAVEEFTTLINAMPAQLETERLRIFAHKLGISEPRAGDTALIEGFLAILQRTGLDFTNSFRALANDVPGKTLFEAPGFKEWSQAWRARIADEIMPQDVARAANPARIPRNHHVEAMITAAVSGNDQPFFDLLAAMAAPFDENKKFSQYEVPPIAEQEITATFCGT